jgi:hypothetical protein
MKFKKALSYMDYPIVGSIYQGCGDQPEKMVTSSTHLQGQKFGEKDK